MGASRDVLIVRLSAVSSSVLRTRNASSPCTELAELVSKLPSRSRMTSYNYNKTSTIRVLMAAMTAAGTANQIFRAWAPSSRPLALLSMPTDRQLHWLACHSTIASQPLMSSSSSPSSSSSSSAASSSSRSNSKARCTPANTQATPRGPLTARGGSTVGYGSILRRDWTLSRAVTASWSRHTCASWLLLKSLWQLQRLHPQECVGLLRSYDRDATASAPELELCARCAPEGIVPAVPWLLR